MIKSIWTFTYGGLFLLSSLSTAVTITPAQQLKTEENIKHCSSVGQELEGGIKGMYHHHLARFYFYFIALPE